jgi:hypothetical protein
VLDDHMFEAVRVASWSIGSFIEINDTKGGTTWHQVIGSGARGRARERPVVRQAAAIAEAARRAQMGCEPELGNLMPYVNRAGLRLFYADSGTGLPVLWHTGGCGDATMWERAGYLAALPGYPSHPVRSPGARAQRGSGRSSGPRHGVLRR